MTTTHFGCERSGRIKPVEVLAHLNPSKIISNCLNQNDLEQKLTQSSLSEKGTFPLNAVELAIRKRTVRRGINGVDRVGRNVLCAVAMEEDGLMGTIDNVEGSPEEKRTSAEAPIPVPQVLPTKHSLLSFAIGYYPTETVPT